MDTLWLIVRSIIGIALAVAIGALLLKVVYSLLYKLTRALRWYCRRFRIPFEAWFRMIVALMGVSILMAENIVFDKYGVTLPITPTVQLVLGYGLIGIVTLSFIIQAKFHAPLVILVQIIGLPLNILYGIVSLIAGITIGNIQDYEDEFKEVYGYDFLPTPENYEKLRMIELMDSMPEGGLGGYAVTINGVTEHFDSDPGNEFYHNGTWYVRESGNTYVKRD